ncbi:MAG: GNAT family N-acetyltransferase [Bacteroidia bacterium]|nr:GNAT family N-acetyltransferase [Bacteroidia bacterium]
MEPILDPVNRDLLKAELTNDKFLRNANNGHNKLYVITQKNAPHVMTEIGRLREWAFRAAGGGTGKAIDIDEFDTSENPYKQLIVWSDEDEEIIGGYRFIDCGQVYKQQKQLHFATTELFHFSQNFIDNYIPFTIELGRSFVQPKYQPSAENRKGLFSLDNLWDGLGALVVDNPHIKYFFGKVTMYTNYNVLARDMILKFMHTYFPDTDQLVTPIHPVHITHNMQNFEKAISGQDYKEGHRILNQQVRALHENIPPLVNAYMNLSPTMKTFGTAVNPGFGDVEETGILVTIADVFESKKERHVNTYQK